MHYITNVYYATHPEQLGRLELCFGKAVTQSLACTMPHSLACTMPHHSDEAHITRYVLLHTRCIQLERLESCFVKAVTQSLTCTMSHTQCNVVHNTCFVLCYNTHCNWEGWNLASIKMSHNHWHVLCHTLSVMQHTITVKCYATQPVQLGRLKSLQAIYRNRKHCHTKNCHTGFSKRFKCSS